MFVKRGKIGVIKSTFRFGRDARAQNYYANYGQRCNGDLQNTWNNFDFKKLETILFCIFKTQYLTGVVFNF